MLINMQSKARVYVRGLYAMYILLMYILLG
jgi:hypothetical protein